MSKRHRRAQPPRRGFLWRWRRFFFLSALVMLTVVSGLAFVLARVPLPPDFIPAETTILTDVNGNRLASLDNGETRVAVDYEDIPKVVVDAVLAAEDKNYFKHSGVDPVGILRALITDVKAGEAKEGGSTITQQYVKNTYVGNEKSLWRKMREAAIAVKLERKYSKQEILQRYMNTVYFGRGAYGVQAAARAYYAKDVGQLELREAAYLAGLIRSPETGDLDSAPEEAKRRRDQTLAAMEDAGFITQKQLDATKKIPMAEYVLPRAQQEPKVVLAEKGTQYFVEYVRKELIATYGEAAVTGGGLRVKTTLDLRLQGLAYDAVYGELAPGEPAGALVSLDSNGEVRAMVGGRDWSAEEPWAKVNLAVGRDGGGTGRQAGSTFKPFLLAEVVRQGYTVESAFPAPAEIVLPKANAGKDYVVANYESQDFGPSVNIIDATRQSVNTVYAQMSAEIGPESLVAMANKLGITSPLEPNASLVLGTEEVSVLEMAGAYSTFSHRGVYVEPHVILEVRDADGRLLEQTSPKRTRVLEQDDADVVNALLEKVVTSGTGTRARIGRPVAGKTGTTQDYSDAWFVGYTPNLTTAVWMGYPEGNERKMTNVRGRRISGGSLPAEIFRRFMEPAVRGTPVVAFPKIENFPGNLLGPARIPANAPPPTTTTVPPTTVPATTVPPPPADGDGDGGGDEEKPRGRDKDKND